MGTAKVAKNFSSSKYTDSGLQLKTGHILEKMTNNSAYEKPDPALATISAMNSRYYNAMLATVGGGKEQTVIKNQLRADLEALLRQLADYVQITSKGDEALILSSGFDVCKKPSVVGMLDKPTGFTLKMGTSKGMVDVYCDSVEYADFYEVSYTTTPVTSSSIWETKTSTKRSISLDGLKSGVEMAFRMAGAGSNPSRVWSDPIVSYVV